MDLILPKNEVETDLPVIFLAGPIKGTYLWQDQAIEIISNFSKQVAIASPSRRVRNEYLANQLASKSHYEFQTSWERHYLERAAKNGCILFWLANQKEEMQISEKTNFHNPYARDTRGELGEWRGRIIHDKSIRLVIGAEPNFPGLDVIQRNFWAIDPHFKFYNSLEDTCKRAVYS